MSGSAIRKDLKTIRLSWSIFANGNQKKGERKRMEQELRILCHPAGSVVCDIQGPDAYVLANERETQQTTGQ